MKEYFLKLDKGGEIKTFRKLLDSKTAKLYDDNIGIPDKNGIVLVEFWEIK